MDIPERQCNIGNKTENKDKTNQTKNKPKKTDEQHVPPQNTGGKPNAREG